MKSLSKNLDCGREIVFFSSRRRHTSSKRDWSSDVCSSDLQAPGHHHDLLHVLPGDEALHVGVGERKRSEERRVGKECRSRSSPHHEKKNISLLNSPSYPPSKEPLTSANTAVPHTLLRHEYV